MTATSLNWRMLLRCIGVDLLLGATFFGIGWMLTGITILVFLSLILFPVAVFTNLCLSVGEDSRTAWHCANAAFFVALSVMCFQFFALLSMSIFDPFVLLFLIGGLTILIVLAIVGNSIYGIASKK